MATHRRRHGGDGDRQSASSRRRFLASLVGGASVGVGAGCTAPLGQMAGRGFPPVSILAAGSLQRAFAEGLAAATDRRVRVETHGSVTAARLVAADKRDPDIVALADTVLFDSVLEMAWHAEFATNELVVACADSAGGRRVARADRWFDPLLGGEATLGRTDPDLDPLGYRTLFALALAADYYDRPELPADLLEPDQIYPETSLLSRFETGSLDAAVVYRSMAVERDYDFRELPAAINLGDPARDDRYRQATYTLPDGTTVRGRHISYGAHARSTATPVVDVYDRLVDGSYLVDHGFGTPESFPRYRGTVPDALA